MNYFEIFVVILCTLSIKCEDQTAFLCKSAMVSNVSCTGNSKCDDVYGTICNIKTGFCVCPNHGICVYIYI